MNLTPRARRTAWRVSLALAVIGLLTAVLGARAPLLAPDRAPVRLTSAATDVRPAGPFGGQLIVYGRPGAGPQAEGLGCMAGGPGSSGRGWTGDGLPQLDRLVIDGTAVVPLLVLTATGSDVTVRCTGPLAPAAAPMYLVTTDGVRDLVPMAAYSLATLLLVLGAAGAWTLRPERIG